MKETFRKIANKISYATGTAAAFLIALSFVILWALTGHFFNYSNTWQLVINTATTIITFLMVFLIQNTQNRDGKAMQLKLDELIRSTKGRNSFIDIEDLDDAELAELDNEFRQLHEKELSTKALHKLHEKIEQEHKRRQNIRRQAEDMLNKINPLSKKQK
ncbi:low affinity iron permease family protein [Candidatus Saccharibacteria bacterium]|nr:low affinity iron permease family protein [Candidatus Saccharibacteria bacterium]